ARLFQSNTRSRAVDELRSEGVGVVQLYSRQSGLETVPFPGLQSALGGDSIFWVPAFRGSQLYQGLPSLSASLVGLDMRHLSESQTTEFSWQGNSYLAVARPLRLGTKLFGALVVAKPKAHLPSPPLTPSTRP